MEKAIWTAAYEAAVQKVERNSRQIGASFPQVALGEKGIYNRENPEYWTSGFWCGLLWLAYRESGEKSLFELACEIEEKLDEPLDTFSHIHHDVGFMWLPTAVFHYQMTGCGVSKVRGMKAASLLASRFNLNGRFIRAWNDDVREGSRGMAIVDCLMNLPLLYWASKVSGDPRFAQIACAHTDTVLKYFVREDYTVPHIVNFDADTGACLGAIHGQGKNADSIWSRGQAWAIYGLAIGFRETGNQLYLDTAIEMAKRFKQSLPEDGAPCWDFCADEEERCVKDTSAACIAASGMLEISQISPREEDRQLFRLYAEEILQKIICNYACFDDSTQGIVQNGTVNFIRERYIQVPIIYGDFYFLEALGKLKGLSGAF